MYREDYAGAGVPMLPVVVGDARCARIILGSALVLVASTLMPALHGLGWIYLAAAVAGGAYFISTCVALVRDPGRRAARASFRASLVQLSLVLFGAIADTALRG